MSSQSNDNRESFSTYANYHLVEQLEYWDSNHKYCMIMMEVDSDGVACWQCEGQGTSNLNFGCQCVFI